MHEEHYIAGARPIRVVVGDGGLQVLKYEWETGRLVTGTEYLPRIWFGRGEVQRIDPAGFAQRVAELQKNLRDLRAPRAALQPVDATPRGRSDMKDRARAMEKIIEDLGGDASLLFDVASSAITYETVDAAYAALEHIRETKEVLRVLDRFAEPMACGYSDLLLNLRMSNGHIAELRLIPEAVSEFWEDHDALAAMPAALATTASKEKRDLSQEEATLVTSLLATLREKYQALVR